MKIRIWIQTVQDERLLGDVLTDSVRRALELYRDEVQALDDRGIPSRLVYRIISSTRAGG
jgi:hypothetical protein